MDIFFHVTFEDNISSILKYGLLPLIGNRSVAVHETVPAIYLFKSLEDVENALSNWLGDMLANDPRRLAVLKIALPFSLSEFLSHSKSSFEYICYETIQPEFIEKLDEKNLPFVLNDESLGVVKAPITVNCHKHPCFAR